MPLQQRTYDLREERDKLDARLDELADRLADISVKFQGDGADDLTDDEIEELALEREEIRNEAQQVQTHLSGLSWAVEEFCEPKVATDGGQPQGSDQDIDDVRTELETEGDDSGPETDESGRPLAGTTSVGDGKAGRSGPASPGQQTPGSNANAKVEDATGSEVVLSGLTAGEFARVQDLTSARSNQMGFAPQQLADDGLSQNIYVAAGHQRAPYITDNATVRTKADQIAALAPDYVAWCRSEIESMTSPSGSAGNAFSRRVSERIAQKTSEKSETAAEEQAT